MSPSAAWLLSRPVSPLAEQRTTFLASTPPGTRSYVEGDTFEDPKEEVEALGGDPFFLDNDEDEKGGKDDGDFLWDGEVDENAHLDLDFD